MADSQPLSGAPEGAEYLRAVLRAPVYEAAQVTPLQKMEKLSSRLDNVILVKREDRQPVHSFKLRGAYAMMAGLTEEQKAHGVITASAGNHAQGVAFSSARLGVKALIVMPTATADWHKYAVEMGVLLEQFQRQRALPGNHHRMVERRHPGEPLLL